MEQEYSFPTPLIEWGVAGRTMEGQGESGDQYVLQPFPYGVLVGVADGLGHGTEAAIASTTAVATLKVAANEPVVSLLNRCHEALRSTRGAVISLASLNALDNTMSWISVGNVEGLLLRAKEGIGRDREYVLPRGGVVGYRLPPLQATVLMVEKGDTLIFATDGIHNGFADELVRSDPPQQIADYILRTHGKDTDDALVLVVRYLGEAT